MEKLFILTVKMIAAICYLAGGAVSANYTVESPQYKAVHSEPDFEIRLYKEMSWMSALVYGTSFCNSTKDGFHRLYQYLHGANQNSTQFMMTAPVVTSITLSSRGGSAYIVRYYLSSKFNKTSPPRPNTELNLQLDKWKSQCIAVRTFPGYARDDNIDNEKDALVSSLGKHFPRVAVGNSTNNFSIAQYNASKHPTGRINEVWMDVSGFTIEGCPI